MGQKLPRAELYAMKYEAEFMFSSFPTSQCDFSLLQGAPHCPPKATCISSINISFMYLEKKPWKCEFDTVLHSCLGHLSFQTQESEYFLSLLNLLWCQTGIKGDRLDYLQDADHIAPT